MTDNGGPAFPNPDWDCEYDRQHEGASLLDLWAGMIAGHVYHSVKGAEDDFDGDFRPVTDGEMAGYAYDLADALLAEKRRREAKA